MKLNKLQVKILEVLSENGGSLLLNSLIDNISIPDNSSALYKMYENGLINAKKIGEDDMRITLTNKGRTHLMVEDTATDDEIIKRTLEFTKSIEVGEPPKKVTLKPRKGFDY